ncbi:MAG: DUF1624 domain-containing protein [Fuerstiella sp.]|nr:DUF1624 domain-containing protein [Fuerstiella sp.]MCP4854307.1 DUF1624 domain-containing protein [Fuerstiella sp.]
MDSGSPQQSRQRLDCIDALRGLVMVFMCLDHSREFFGDLRVQPEDLETTTPLLFATRWVTHFCAPTFIFLAGTSAWLYGQKTGDRRQLARFLWTRGLWLILLEFTVVYFGWFFSIGPFPLMFIVIAAIGFCMIVLSVLIFLPYKLLCAVGLLIVVLHNTLDPVQPSDFGMCSWLWQLLHDGGLIGLLNMDVGYPVLAWIGVIVCGYCFGAVLEQDQGQRRRTCFKIGSLCVMLFLILRTANLYGDPSPRVVDAGWQVSIMSFLMCTKYPPSLLYLLMTLGPALIVLGGFDQMPPKTYAGEKLRTALLAYGRVPLFFYIAHLYLIHASSRLLYWVVRGEPLSPVATAFRCFTNESEFPENYGFPLWVVYPAWLVMLLILWPLCAWYGQRKRRGQHFFWSYL